MTRIRLLYVHEYRDRHGHLRRYFRRKGSRPVALPGAPGSTEFMAVYQAALGNTSPGRPPEAAPGTLGALILRFYQSAEFANLKPASRRVYRIVLDSLAEKHGHRLVRDLPRDKARKIIEGIGATRPAMANLTAKVLRRLLGYAIDINLRTDNPLTRAPAYRIGTRHTWTDAELAAFEARWPVGTRERLAYALLLYTGQRGGDVVRMTRADIKAGVSTSRSKRPARSCRSQSTRRSRERSQPDRQTA